MKPRIPDNSETPAKFSAFQRATPMAVVLTHADRAYSPRPKQQALRDTKGPAADAQFEVRAMAIILTIVLPFLFAGLIALTWTAHQLSLPK
jgi:hypothetical protein